MAGPTGPFATALSRVSVNRRLFRSCGVWVVLELSVFGNTSEFGACKVSPVA